MQFLIDLHERVFEEIDALFSPAVVSFLMRLAFAIGLLFFFWNSALTKVDAANGVAGFFTVKDNAFVQIAPLAYEAAEYDASQLGAHYWLMAYAGTYGEFLFPLLVVIGLFTRLASVAMIGFIVVMSLVDVSGHSKNFTDHVIQSRVLWIAVLGYLAVRGGGLLSVDRIWGPTSAWSVRR